MQAAALCVYLAVQLLLDLICISSGSEVKQTSCRLSSHAVAAVQPGVTAQSEGGFLCLRVKLRKLFPTSIQLI